MSDSACSVCEQAAVASCVRCGRQLCETHSVRGTGTSLVVFGPWFNDGKTRCGDCHNARFWSAAMTALLLLGCVGILVSSIEGHLWGAVAGLAIAIVGGGLAWRRSETFRRSERATRRDAE